jgi:hypothetical protein
MVASQEGLSSMKLVIFCVIEINCKANAAESWILPGEITGRHS